MVQLRRTSRKTEQRRRNQRELRRSQNNDKNNSSARPSNRTSSGTSNRGSSNSNSRRTNNNNRKERFQDADSNEEDEEPDTLVDFLKVAVEDTSDTPLHEREYTGNLQRYQTYGEKFLYLVMKYGLMVLLMTMNFIALSLSLNCNVDQEFFTRLFSAIFAFFFGFIYILVNYYTYRVLGQGKICKCDKEALFPFKI